MFFLGEKHASEEVWLLNGGDFNHQRIFGLVWRYFLLPHLGWGCYWHLVADLKDGPTANQSQMSAVPRVRNPELGGGGSGVVFQELCLVSDLFLNHLPLAWPRE